MKNEIKLNYLNLLRMKQMQYGERDIFSETA